MKLKRKVFCAIVAALSVVFTSSLALGRAVHIRWDLVSINFATGDLNAGGVARALANDGSVIELSGSGTFVAPTGGGPSSAVTGGGTWMTSGPIGADSGTYSVTGLVRWDQAPGTFPPGVKDNIGNAADARAGLAVLRIEYSDGSRGVLVVSCHLVGTGARVFEGITASKGFVDFWNRQAPVDGVDANRTLFHAVR